MAYTIDTKANEEYEVFIRHIPTSSVIGSIPHVHSVEWSTDGRHIFYTVPDDLKRPYKVMRHCITEHYRLDEMLYEEHDPSFFVDIRRTKDKKFLTINSNSKTSSEVHIIEAFVPRPSVPSVKSSSSSSLLSSIVAAALEIGKKDTLFPSNSNVHSSVDLRDIAMPTLRLIHPREPNLEYYVDHVQDRFYIVTNADEAFNYKLVSVADCDPRKANWRTVLPLDPERKIENLDIFEHHFVIYSREKGLPKITVYDGDFLREKKPDEINPSKRFDIPLPEDICTVEPGVNLNFATNRLRFSYSSLITYECTYDYDMDKRELFLLRKKIVKGFPPFNPSEYECSRIFVTLSNSSTAVPMTIVHKKGIPLDGRNPALMIGYGAYGHNVEASFHTEYLELLRRNWVIALAHVRGGSELGVRWYHEGKQLSKRNSFHDFIACAEHLIAQGYTCSQRLTAMGSSAGGLLLGALLNMRPDLFRAMIVKVPFVDGRR